MIEIQKHVGAGMLETPELLLRQVLMEGLRELAGDRARQDELFLRVDSLRQGTQEEWAEDMRDLLARLVRFHEEGGLQVSVGYPMDDATYPYVSLVTEGASESPGGAVMGDVLGRTYRVIGTATADDWDSSSTERHKIVGVDYTTNLQVGCWALASEESMLVLALVRHLLFRHKGRLFEAGVRELTFSESGFQPSPDLYPRTGYVPVVRCTLEWTLRQTRRTRPVPTRVRMRTGTYSS